MYSFNTTWYIITIEWLYSSILRTLKLFHRVSSSKEKDKSGQFMYGHQLLVTAVLFPAHCIFHVSTCIYLQIKNISKELAGRYSCVIRDVIEEYSSQSYNLTVLGAHSGKHFPLILHSHVRVIGIQSAAQTSWKKALPFHIAITHNSFVYLTLSYVLYARQMLKMHPNEPIFFSSVHFSVVVTVLAA